MREYYTPIQMRLLAHHDNTEIAIGKVCTLYSRYMVLTFAYFF